MKLVLGLFALAPSLLCAAAVELTVLQSTDIHGSPNIVKFSKWIAAERAADPEALVVDCGDLCNGTFETYNDGGASTPFAGGRRALTVGLGDQRLGDHLNSVETCFALAIEKAGNVPLIIPCTTNAQTISHLLDKIDVLVLTGGADVDTARYGEKRSPKCGAPDLERDAFEFALVEAARKRRLPMLGICRGSQLLNVAFGGTLYQDLPSEKPSSVRHGFGDYYHPGDTDTAAHPVEIAPDSLFAKVLGSAPIAANSHHHQAVKKPGDGIRIVGRAPDGVVEIWEHRSYPVMGIQFHPESPVGYLEKSGVYDLPRLKKVYDELLRELAGLSMNL